MAEEVEIERHDNVLVLTLVRPDKLNALSPRLIAGLRSGIAAARAEDVNVLLLAGAGRSFCSGGDMELLGSDNEDVARLYIQSVTEVLAELRSFPKPLVVAVQGYAVGAGAEFACEADLLIVSSDAVLRFSDVSIGSTPATVRSLVRVVGLPTAKRMVLLGEDLVAARALELGAVYDVVPQDALRETALATAKKLANLERLPLRFAKRAFRLADTTDPILELALNLEAEIACYMSAGLRGYATSFRGVEGAA